MSIQPFTIDISQVELDDLHDRLARTRWPDALPNVGWNYGVPLGYLRELTTYWRDSYHWRDWEAKLNSFPQFTTEIDGANIHFLHVRSPEPDALPLILTHGWPGSVVEFLEIIGPLTNPRAHGAEATNAFHLVIPSLPGFGFSGPTRETGWEVLRIARAWAKLMDRLDYTRYGVQGGDWGAAISRELGRMRPEVIGVHLNMLPGAYITKDPANLSGLPLAEADRARESWERFTVWTRERQGYADIQSTRPQTLAYGLTDSPVGQLAWIAEKFHEWTDLPINRDVLLTNVMMYWLTRTAGPSARLYYERAHADYWGTSPEWSATPTAVALFPRENFVLLRYIAEQTNNIVQWTEFDRGGHFAAMEVPDLLVGDMRDFFQRLR